MNKRDEVREQIASKIAMFVVSGGGFVAPKDVQKLVNGILALDGLAVVDREAELPNPEPSSLDPQYEGETLHYGRVCGEMGYRRAQQDMVKKDWVEEVIGGM